MSPVKPEQRVSEEPVESSLFDFMMTLVGISGDLEGWCTLLQLQKDHPELLSHTVVAAKLHFQRVTKGEIDRLCAMHVDVTGQLDAKQIGVEP